MTRPFVPSPLPRSPRWPGLVVSVGGENAIRQYMAANPSEGGDDRWLRGYEFVPFDCAGEGSEQGGVALCTDRPDYTPSGMPGSVGYDPMLLWESMNCSTLSGGSMELRSRVENKLLTSTSHRLEREFWTGTVGTAAGAPNVYLSQASGLTKPNGNTATPLVHALATLNHAAGFFAQGSRLMHHVTPFTAQLWKAAGAIDVDSSTGLLLDPFGNIVVAGTGYDGSGATSVDGYSTAWAYTTTVVNVRLSDIRVVDSANTRIDLGNNVELATASRIGGVTFDGCVRVGILVDHDNVCG